MESVEIESLLKVLQSVERVSDVTGEPLERVKYIATVTNALESKALSTDLDYYERFLCMQYHTIKTQNPKLHHLDIIRWMQHKHNHKRADLNRILDQSNTYLKFLRTKDKVVDINEILSLLDQGKNPRTVAAKFGITEYSVQEIRTSETERQLQKLRSHVTILEHTIDILWNYIYERHSPTAQPLLPDGSDLHPARPLNNTSLE